jgi:hypothetical protein
MLTTCGFIEIIAEEVFATVFFILSLVFHQKVISKRWGVHTYEYNCMALNLFQTQNRLALL